MPSQFLKASDKSGMSEALTSGTKFKGGASKIKIMVNILMTYFKIKISARHRQ